MYLPALPLPTGTYPSPKACATMTVWKHQLVLFGGWSQPTPFPLHQVSDVTSCVYIASRLSLNYLTNHLIDEVKPNVRFMVYDGSV